MTKNQCEMSGCEASGYDVKLICVLDRAHLLCEPHICEVDNDADMISRTASRSVFEAARRAAEHAGDPIKAMFYATEFTRMNNAGALRLKELLSGLAKMVAGPAAVAEVVEEKTRGT